VRVLVVDDEPSICRALTIALSRAGFDAVAAQSGDAAIALVRKEHFDVLIVDLRIPDMRGDVVFELAAALQPQLRTQTLFMTGDITERAQKIIAACQCPLLRKPFDLRDVFDAVTALAPRVRGATA
jgi:DNA-binding response OmpR family regulator